MHPGSTLKYELVQKLAVFVMAVFAIAVPCFARAHKEHKKAVRGGKRVVQSSARHAAASGRAAAGRSSGKRKASSSRRVRSSSSRYARNEHGARRHAKGHTERHAARTPKQLSPSSERYQQIQQALADRGYFHGTPDGAWGPDSVDALKRFQADQNLKPDGKLGSMSLIALGLGPRRLSAQTHERPAPAPQNVPPPTESIQDKP